MRIAITADHNGVALKERLCAWLERHGHEVDDRAAHVGEEVVDYPPLCEDVCRRVLDGHADFAIVVGGSGSGEAIACNKIRGIRAGLCLDLFVAEIARANNDANVLVTGAKVVSPELAEQILATWLATSFRGERHQRRLDQIAALERGESLIARSPGTPSPSAGPSARSAR
jgi:ribose 5-phosphate isomerase B